MRTRPLRSITAFSLRHEHFSFCQCRLSETTRSPLANADREQLTSGSANRLTPTTAVRRDNREWGRFRRSLRTIIADPSCGLD